MKTIGTTLYTPNIVKSVVIGMTFCAGSAAHAQLVIDPNWGTLAETFNLNCISLDCGGGGVSGGDSMAGPFDDKVQDNPASSTISNSLGSTTVTADFMSIAPGLNGMQFTGNSTSSSLGISDGSAQALGLYSYSGPPTNITITLTLDPGAVLVGPTSGEDNNIDGISGRVLIFTDEFSIEELGFEVGAALTCLGECYSPDAVLFVNAEAAVNPFMESIEIGVDDGDTFYVHGQMELGSAGGGSADPGTGVTVTFSPTAGLSSVPGGGAPLDTDGDGVADDMDNCTLVVNADQRDTNGDGYGNQCDPDLNNDNLVNFIDIAAWSAAFNTVTSGDEDFNGDGIANFLDFTLIPEYFLGPPGPSGVAP